MAISILTNVQSMTAQRNLANTQRAVAGNIAKLSSGMRISRAGDDAAGLGISENLKADIRSMSQAARNANDGVSMSQVAEGALNEQQGLVTRMRELAVQSSNGTLGATERGYIQTEFGELRSELDRISSVTEFNGQMLLDGSAAAGLTMQIGIQNTANDRIAMTVAQTDSTTLGGGTFIAGADLSTAAGAQAALDTFDTAIAELSTSRASVGAFQNRLSVTISNLEVAGENLSAANSRIRDVDVASETASFTRNQILSQAGISVLGQANQLPQAALGLLR